MHVLYVLSFIVERVGFAIRPYSGSLIQYLPLLWEESAEHNMLRCAIVSTLVHLVKVCILSLYFEYFFKVMFLVLSFISFCRHTEKYYFLKTLDTFPQFKLDMKLYQIT